jgi:hypothetical protein
MFRKRTPEPEIVQDVYDDAAPKKSRGSKRPELKKVKRIILLRLKNLVSF